MCSDKMRSSSVPLRLASHFLWTISSFHVQYLDIFVQGSSVGQVHQRTAEVFLHAEVGQRERNVVRHRPDLSIGSMKPWRDLTKDGVF